MSEALIAGWRYRALVLSIIAAMAGYLAFSLWGGWQDVVRAMELVGLGGLAAALAMSLLNYALRFVRWQLYLGELGHRLAAPASARIYLAGFALTTTPGKAGEMLRGVLLRRHGVPWSDSFAAFVSERLSDLAAIVLLTLLGLALYPGAGALVLVGAGAVLAGLLVLSRRQLLAHWHARTAAAAGRLRRLLHHGLHTLLQASRCHRPTLLLAATALSLVAWAAEALAFLWILNWLGMEVDFAFAAFVYAVAMLAGALSFMPGGLGGAEAAMVALLLWRGMPLPDAVAATVLIRLATLWFAVVLGVIALGADQRVAD